ncbi:unnamed protein product [Meloidogyne enterolobii]|uniref:Uncharacterized protein n=1 Tax=Meloidogyne enterolobii TaxID=390850 RepID=A0ACB0Z9R8_MELEN
MKIKILQQIFKILGKLKLIIQRRTKGEEEEGGGGGKRGKLVVVEPELFGDSLFEITR